MAERTIVVIGGTSGIGLEIARAIAKRGDAVVITSRDAERARTVAESLGGSATGIALDLSKPASIAASLQSIGAINGIVLSAIERDANSVTDYNVDRALRLATIKLVGYTEVVHALSGRLEKSVDTGIVLFGGLSAFRPYPGSLTVSTVNAGVDGILVSLTGELSPIRVNSLHPGIIGDSPFWSGMPDGALGGYEARTPGGELATTADIVHATLFLLDNRGVSGVSLNVDRGTRVA